MSWCKKSPCRCEILIVKRMKDLCSNITILWLMCCFKACLAFYTTLHSNNHQAMLVVMYIHLPCHLIHCKHLAILELSTLLPLCHDSLLCIYSVHCSPECIICPSSVNKRGKSLKYAALIVKSWKGNSFSRKQRKQKQKASETRCCFIIFSDWALGD